MIQFYFFSILFLISALLRYSLVKNWWQRRNSKFLYKQQFARKTILHNVCNFFFFKYNLVMLAFFQQNNILFLWKWPHTNWISGKKVLNAICWDKVSLALREREKVRERDTESYVQMHTGRRGLHAANFYSVLKCNVIATD